MDRSTRTLLMAGAAVTAALGLTVASISAQDGESEAEGLHAMDPMEPGLHVMEPWARTSPMVDLAGAAYMVIHNNTDADDALVGASTPASEVVELHLSSMDDEGMMSMNQVNEIAVPAHGEAVLKPGSYHLMLIGLTEPLAEETMVQITLEFMTAEPQTIAAPVLSMPPMGEMEMGHDMDHEMDDEDSMGDMDESMEEDEG